jgi:3-oxoacyl-(acyl-carrier-protein) synthase
MNEDKRVVITGIGPLTSLGIGKEALWNGIMNSRTGLIVFDWSLEEAGVDSFFIHKVQDFDISHFGLDEERLFEIKTWKEGQDELDLFYLMAAAKLALDDSGLTVSSLIGKDIGLILTHENPGLEQYTSKNFSEFYKFVKNNPDWSADMTIKNLLTHLYPRIAKSGYETQTFMFLYHIARVLDIHGFSLFTNNSCSSGLYALETASLLIKSQKSPVIVISASDRPGLYKYLWFKEMNMYSKNGKIKPFDTMADGFVFGEGAVGMVVERLDHALKRGAPIYGEYIGGGFIMEGWKITLPHITETHYQQTIINALKEAHVRPEDIDLICAHGVGNKVIDAYEARAIYDVFGSHDKGPPVTAFKPYIGHTLGGAALLETAISLLAMQNNIIPPVLNSTLIDKKKGINIVRKTLVKEIKKVLRICCGFAGFNSAAIFKKYEV